MRYRLVKSKNKVTCAKDRYVAKVCHDQVLDFDHFAQRIQDSTTLTIADIKCALSAFGEQLCRSLRQGDIVKLPDIGTFKLEMECTPVDDPAEFKLSQNLKRYQLHVIPESKNGKQALYEDIKLERVKD